MFRAVLDVQARTVTDEMAIAVARELAQIAERRGLGPTSMLPRIDDSELHASVA